MKVLGIRLKKIDLSKAKESNCSGIKADCQTQYLCLIGSKFFAGTFSKVWFGITFNDFYSTSYQFDAPGYNQSKWKGVWKIVCKKKRSNE